MIVKSFIFNLNDNLLKIHLKMNTLNDCPLECGIKIKSFYKHFQRCTRKDLFGKFYLKCRYDYNHIVKKENYDHHLENCDKSNSIILLLKIGCFNSDEEDEDDLQKMLDKKRKIKAENKDEEIFYKFSCEKIDSECISDINKEISDMMFENENEIDDDSINFYKFVYS